MEFGYLGSLMEPAIADDVAGPAVCRHDDTEKQWFLKDGRKLSLCAHGEHFPVFTSGPLSLLIRGYARHGRQAGFCRPRQVAEEIFPHYREQGDLPIEALEGSFTLILLDAAEGRVLMYRNLAGNGWTYYTQTGAGLVFANNLADLVGALDTTPVPNHDRLPDFFLYRCVPGRDTLFEGIHRLLPGEVVTFDARGLRRSQRQTFGAFHEERAVGPDAVDRIDEVMSRVIADCLALHPQSVNLLSGGVDSSYIQAIWEQVEAPGQFPSRSISVGVDHPMTRADTEYALSASRELGTEHTLVTAEGPYLPYLLETISRTGEPPNHVQAAYFALLGRAMTARGFTTGLSGEGADATFGLGTANRVHNAQVLRLLAPLRSLRRLGMSTATLLGASRLNEYFHLAEHLHNIEDLRHPVNCQAAFTDWPSVQACFGNAAVRGASSDRRAILDLYQVPQDVMVQLHAINFLTYSVDSAALWTGLINLAGGELFCPILDSRLLRLALNIDPRYRFPFRRPKELLKRALARRTSHEMGYRTKRGFGQPIFEWMSAAGQLRRVIDRIGNYEFLNKEVVAQARQTPNWFLYNLMCYDVWHKTFIEKSISRDAEERHLEPAEAVR